MSYERKYYCPNCGMSITNSRGAQQHVGETCRRNDRLIYDRRHKDLTYKALADKYDLSVGQVGHILHGYRRGRRAEGKVYQELEDSP